MFTIHLSKCKLIGLQVIQFFVFKLNLIQSIFLFDFIVNFDEGMRMKKRGFLIFEDKLKIIFIFLDTQICILC